MSADPSITALIAAGGGGDPLQGTIAAVERAGKVGKIHVVSTDFLPDLEERLENGSMTAESGGHFWDPMFAFMLVYNSIKGNYPDSSDAYAEVEFPYIYVSSPEEYKLFDEYFVKMPAYTDNEICEIANMTIDQLKEKASTLSIEDTIARSKGR